MHDMHLFGYGQPLCALIFGIYRWDEISSNLLSTQTYVAQLTLRIGFCTKLNTTLKVQAIVSQINATSLSLLRRRISIYNLSYARHLRMHTTLARFICTATAIM